MIKKLVTVLLISVLSMLTVFSAGRAEIGEMTPAAEIVPPHPSIELFELPVDQMPEQPLRIAVIMVTNNPFGMAVKEGADFARDVLADRNTRVDWVSVPDFDPLAFEEAMRNAITAQYDAITLFGLSEALTSIVNQAERSGIPVFSFNTEPGDDSDRTAYYGQDGYAGGQACGEFLVDLMGGEGKYAIITGSFNVLGHELRRRGARDVIDQHSGMQLVGEFENQDRAEEAFNVAENLISAHPDLRGIYVTAGGPFGAARAVRDAGLAGEIEIVCHDWMEETIDYVRQGVISAVLDQDPFNQGYAPVIAAYNYLVAGIEPEEINWFEGEFATPDNVDEVVPD